MRSVVLMPTYNERDNLSSLLDEVLATAPVDVIVIDDNSPDGTGQLADLLAKKEPRIRVLHRPERQGIGPAYLDGFRRALDEGYDIILQMDADFSHQPRYLPAFFEALEHADVAIGSRYVDGGGIDNWGVGRRIVSRASNLYARSLLECPYRDLTAGFVAFRRRVLEAIDLDTIVADGYAFQVELKFRAHRLGFTIVEVPIRFWDRVAGSTKLAKVSVAKAALHVVKLRRVRDH